MDEENRKSLEEMTAFERLTIFVDHLGIATEMARLEGSKNAKVGLAVMSVEPDGSGRITARFEGEFAKDLKEVLDFVRCTNDFQQKTLLELYLKFKEEQKNGEE